MHVRSVNLFYSLNRKGLKDSKTDTSKTTCRDSFLNKPQAECFSYPSFGCLSRSKLMDLAYRNVPCPYSSILMIPNAVANKVLTQENLSKPIASAIKYLEPFANRMFPVEKQCFDILKQAAKEQPQMRIQEILVKLKGNSLEHLKNSQFDILDRIDNIGLGLSDDSFDELIRITDQTREVIFSDSYTKGFKRKTAIRQFDEFRKNLPEEEKTIGDEIYNCSKEFINSENSLDAFIAKYSRRTSREIGQRLVSKSFATLEHVHPQSQHFDGTEINRPGNWLVASAGYNNGRGDEAFDKYVRKRPEIIQYIQKHLDRVIDLNNSGQIYDYEEYLKDIAETLKVESKGLVNPDISRLKVPNNFIMDFY